MTLALYGKTRRRQGGLLLAGFLAIFAAVLIAVTAMPSDVAKADSASLAASSASCTDPQLIVQITDNDPAACSGANAAALSAGGATVNVETDDAGFPSGDTLQGADDLNVTFSLAGIPDGSTISATSAVKVWSTASDAAGSLRVGSNAGGSQYGTAALAAPQTYTNAALITAITNGLAGNSITIRLSMDCSPNSDDCGALIDQVSLDVTWTPPAPPPDADGDGVTDASDQCPGTAPGAVVNANGCSFAQFLAAINVGTSNPAIASNVCQEANFSFVVDRSGSMSDAETDSLRGGVNVFTAAYALGGGVGSYQLSTFNNGGAAVLTTGYENLAGFTADLNANIDGGGSGLTPTTAGIEAGDAKNGADPDQHIMFVITDGSPNQPPANPDLDLPATWINAATSAINAANFARTQGFAVRAIWAETTDAMPFDGMFGPGSNLAFAAAVMDEIGGGEHFTAGTFGDIAAGLTSSIDCGSRNVRVVKVTEPGTHPAAAFSGTITPGGADAANQTWSQNLAANGTSSGAGETNVVSRQAQNVDENAPPTGWAETGYFVAVDTAAAPTACPEAGSASYTGTSGAVPAGVLNYVVCVRNTFTPPPPQDRTVRIIKTTNTGDHPGGSFAGTILPGQTNPADSTWDATLAPDAASAPAGSFETSQTVQTVDENTPPSGWAENGYAVIADPNGSATCAGATYAAVGSATVPAGSADYLVCVRNTFTPGGVNVSKSDTGESPYSPGEEFAWWISFTVSGGPNFGAKAYLDNLPFGTEFAPAPPPVVEGPVLSGGATAGQLSCAPAVAAVNCTLADGAPAGTYSIKVNVRVIGSFVGAQCPDEATNVVTSDTAQVASDTVPIDCPDPDITIRVCKVWFLDQPNEIADPGTVNFDFEISDTEQSDSFQLGATEGGDPSCILIDVRPGQVSIEELIGDLPGFNLDGWSIRPGSTVPDSAENDTNPAEFDIPDDCQVDASAMDSILGIVRSIAALTIPSASQNDPRCTITFYNYDDQNRLPSGNLRIEKYIDINRDGDADDPGEGLFDGWPISIVGNDIGGNYLTGEGIHPTGTLVFDGLDSEDFYDISEGAVPGYVVVSAFIGATNMGAVSSVSGVDIPEGGTVVVRFYNSPSGSITVHKNTVNVLNGIETPNLNDDDGWRITVDSTACNVHLSGDTDGNGDITFTGLEMCSDYRVAEDLSDPGAPGYTPAGSSFVNGITPGATVPTLVTFTNETRSFTPPCPNCAPGTQTVPTPIPTPPVATVTPCVGCGPGGVTAPTLTPVPTTAPASPTAVSTIAGDRTPGPGQTPVAPSTGEGGPGGGSGLNMLLILGGLIALGSGFTFMAMGRKNRS